MIDLTEHHRFNRFERWISGEKYHEMQVRARQMGPGPNGRRRCQWCLEEVPKGRASWCSQDCVNEFLIRRQSNEVGRRVYARDHGVCRACGTDTKAIHDHLVGLLKPQGRDAIEMKEFALQSGAQQDAHVADQFARVERLMTEIETFAAQSGILAERTTQRWGVTAKPYTVTMWIEDCLTRWSRDHYGHIKGGEWSWGKQRAVVLVRYRIGQLWEADHIVPVSEGGGCCGLDNYQTLCRACHHRDTAELKRRLAEARKSQTRLVL